MNGLQTPHQQLSAEAPTGDYTVVQLKRQEELTRAIQDRLGEAEQKVKKETERVEGAAASRYDEVNLACVNTD